VLKSLSLRYPLWRRFLLDVLRGRRAPLHHNASFATSLQYLPHSRRLTMCESFLANVAHTTYLSNGGIQASSWPDHAMKVCECNSQYAGRGRSRTIKCLTHHFRNVRHQHYLSQSPLPQWASISHLLHAVISAATVSFYCFSTDMRHPFSRN
jgi:hypothetical protein